MKLCMNRVTLLFFELLQISLGHLTELSHIPSEKEWRELFILSKKQALIGVSYVAVEKLPVQQRPPRQVLLQWYVTAEHIEKLNEELNTKAISISRKFYRDGFRNIILKGQGVAQYYNKDRLEKYRMPGDVDIWLEGSRKEIVEYVRNYMPNAKIVYHHVDFPQIDDVEVEVHFTPSWMNSYFTNKVLQHYFAQSKDVLFANSDRDVNYIPTPTLNFNRVYILVHIYRHLFHEGIGLRQLMDYYYVLRQGFTENERIETMRTLRSLNMGHFATAVMWLLQEVFGMEDKYLLISPNEKAGRFLLNEVMKSGNFGQYDKHLSRKVQESDFCYGIRKVKRNLRFVRSYPSEVLWSPIFKIWHYFWRKQQYYTR